MPRKTTGLGWANRAVSGVKAEKPKPSIVAAVVLANDLVDAIEQANFKYCGTHGMTPHMKAAIANYDAWKKRVFND